MRVKAQSEEGTWCKGVVVGYSSRYEGRIEAVILVDQVKETGGLWVESTPFLISEWIQSVIVLETTHQSQ